MKPRASLLPPTPTLPRVSADDLQPPRFGSGAKAHLYPWRIPERTVQNGIAADEAQIAFFTIRAASIVGPGHRCADPATPRQDAYRIGRDRDDRHAILAVADGLSSARLSDIGAAAAASHAVTLLREAVQLRPGIDGLEATRIYAEIAKSMTEQADARGAESRDIASVLITAVLEEPAEPGGDARAWAAWIGDCSGWVLLPGEKRWQFCIGDRKDSGFELATNEVASYLPDSPYQVRQHTFLLPPDSALALVTDGISDAWATLDEANRYFAKSWRRPRPAAVFLNDIGYDARQLVDDRTAVVVWNGPQR